LHTEAGYYAFADAFLMVGSIVTTVLTVARVVENWWYWLAINITSVVLYGSKGIWITSCLAVLYSVLSIRGLIAWRRSFLGGSYESMNKLMAEESKVGPSEPR
jgi:nicotinamide mononucleotide transporter